MRYWVDSWSLWVVFMLLLARNLWFYMSMYNYCTQFAITELQQCIVIRRRRMRGFRNTGHDYCRCNILLQNVMSKIFSDINHKLLSPLWPWWCGEQGLCDRDGSRIKYKVTLISVVYNLFSPLLCDPLVLLPPKPATVCEGLLTKIFGYQFIIS